MQTLSPILVLRMQQPVLWLEQGCEPTLCSFTQSGILSSWLVKAYLKAGRGEKPGSFWNINMLRNYIATIWINTTGTPCVSTAPKVQTHTQIFSKSLIKVRHDAAPWTVSFHTCHSHGKIHITFEGRDQEGRYCDHTISDFGPWRTFILTPSQDLRDAECILVSRCEWGDGND